MIELQLIDAYQKLSDHTSKECGVSCQDKKGLKYRCCQKLFCVLAEVHAREHWGVDLKPYELEANNDEMIYFKWDNAEQTVGRCLLPPHLRPSCTIHNCGISSLGIKWHDPEWTKEYYELLKGIIKLEDERWTESQHKLDGVQE